MDRRDWDRRYADTDRLWSEEPNRFVVEQLSALAPGRALDLAAGEGRNAVWLAGRGWTVDALDFSTVALERARRLAAARGLAVRWIEADVEAYPLGASAYDLVLLAYLHLPWRRMHGVLGSALGALAPGGTFLLVGHDRTNLERGHGGPRSAEVLYTAEQVAAVLGGLEIVEAGSRRRAIETPEGRATAIDCLLLARRPL